MGTWSRGRFECIIIMVWMQMAPNVKAHKQKSAQHLILISMRLHLWRSCNEARDYVRRVIYRKQNLIWESLHFTQEDHWWQCATQLQISPTVNFPINHSQVRPLWYCDFLEFFCCRSLVWSARICAWYVTCIWLSASSVATQSTWLPIRWIGIMPEYVDTCGNIYFSVTFRNCECIYCDMKMSCYFRLYTADTFACINKFRSEQQFLGWGNVRSISMSTIILYDICDEQRCMYLPFLSSRSTLAVQW